MRLTVIGCSGSMPGPDSPASCYLVQAPYEGRTFSLLLDLGPGALGLLYRYLDPRRVDAFALSHLHPDHCLDLCAYYVLARYSPTAPFPDLVKPRRVTWLVDRYGLPVTYFRRILRGKV